MTTQISLSDVILWLKVSPRCENLSQRDWNVPFIQCLSETSPMGDVDLISFGVEGILEDDETTSKFVKALSELRHQRAVRLLVNVAVYLDAGFAAQNFLLPLRLTNAVGLHFDEMEISVYATKTDSELSSH